MASAISHRMIDWERLSTPGANRRPRLRWCGPERVVRGEAERQHRDGTEVETAGGDVGLANTGLMAAKTDRQPAVRIERAWRFEGFSDDGRQRATDLRRRNPLRKRTA